MDLFSLQNMKNFYLESFYSVENFNYNNGQKIRFKKKKAEMQELPRRRKILFSFCSKFRVHN